MNHKAKLNHNVQLLTTNNKCVPIYIPMQFGHLSKHQYRATVIEQFDVPDGEGYKTIKVLSFGNQNNTKTRRIIWWHKLIGKESRGRVFEYSFEKYSKEYLDGLRQNAIVREEVTESNDGLFEKITG